MDLNRWSVYKNTFHGSYSRFACTIEAEFKTGINGTRLAAVVYTVGITRNGVDFEYRDFLHAEDAFKYCEDYNEKDMKNLEKESEIHYDLEHGIPWKMRYWKDDYEVSPWRNMTMEDLRNGLSDDYDYEKETVE